MSEIGDELDAAAAAHMNWRIRLRKAAENKETGLPVAEICSNDHCRFGKWIKTVDKSVQGGEHLSRVDSLHTEFHKVAGGIALQISKGEFDAALRGLSTAPYTSTSRALSEELDKWKKSLN